MRKHRRRTAGAPMKNHSSLTWFLLAAGASAAGYFGYKHFAEPEKKELSSGERAETGGFNLFRAIKSAFKKETGNLLNQALGPAFAQLAPQINLVVSQLQPAQLQAALGPLGLDPNAIASTLTAIQQQGLATIADPNALAMAIGVTPQTAQAVFQQVKSMALAQIDVNGFANAHGLPPQLVQQGISALSQATGSLSNLLPH